MPAFPASAAVTSATWGATCPTCGHTHQVPKADGDAAAPGVDKPAEKKPMPTTDLKPVGAEKPKAKEDKPKEK